MSAIPGVIIQLATAGVLVSPMQITGGHIQEASGAGNCVNMSHWHESCGKAAYTLNAATDTTVAVALEIRTPTTGDDSFFIWVDDGAPELWSAPRRAVFTWEAAPTSFTLAAGFHTLYIGLREAGAQLRALHIAAGDAAFGPGCDVANGGCGCGGLGAATQSSCHEISCGRGAASGCGAAVPTCADNDDTTEVRCCADSDLGSLWRMKGNCSTAGVYGYSGTGEGCSGALTYSAAVAHCGAAGGRLCTAAELESGCTTSTGCSYDANLVWSSTGGYTNVAFNQSATQSSTGHGGVAARAVDGESSSQWGTASCTHTHSGAAEWWQVDLGAMTTVTDFNLFHRTDCCQDRLIGANVTVSATADYTTGTVCQVATDGGNVAQPETGTCGGAPGQFITVSYTGDYITICEFEILGSRANVRITAAGSVGCPAQGASLPRTHTHARLN